MEISESLRSDKMEVDETTQIYKRKTSTEIPNEKIEITQSQEITKNLNGLEIIEAIFQVKIQSENIAKSDNSIFTIRVDPTLLNCMLFQISS